MLKDVDLRLFEWGDWVRERQDFGLGYPRRNIIHKAMREGPGAGSSSKSPDLPMPEPIERMESAICGLSGGLKQTVIYRYVAQDTDRVASDKLKVSVAQYRQRIDQVHYYIAGVLGLEAA